jgi:hypothetical protein
VIRRGGAPLARYVYRPDDAQLESPRPYLHPVWTLAGHEVSLNRPHDHVWHKGIALSLPNVRGPGGTANFWGGPTYLREHAYVQLPNNGAMRHVGFAERSGAGVAHELTWVTEPGATWFTETRRLSFAAGPDAWTLVFDTRITNVSGAEVVFGSPTTEGRDNAGYGGLFWRGPRSFTGGRVYVAGRSGADDLMGVRAPWMAFTGVHDGSGARSTLVMVDGPDNPGHPTPWFVRSEIFACLCPAPFFATEWSLADRAELRLRYAVVVADGDPGPDGAAELADAARELL